MSYGQTAIPAAAAPDLATAARLAMARCPDMRVVVFEWNGARHVLKRIARKPRSGFKRWFLRALLRRLFPGEVRDGNFGLGDGLFEARRIRALAEAGMRVPPVELELPQALVYGYCGVPLRQHLKRQSQAEVERLLIAAARDLAQFHRAGGWHGGAQLRNVLVQGEPGKEIFCRIDFEEDLEGLLSLPVLQIYDLCLFLVEALRFAKDQDETQALGERLLAAYRAVYWPATQQELWSRLAVVARRLRGFRVLLQWLDHKESNRVLVLSRLLEASDASRAGRPSLS